MRCVRHLCVLVALPLVVAACSAPRDAPRRESGVAFQAHPKERTSLFFSQPFLVDRIFPSMQGPYTTHPIQLGAKNEHELLWLTGLFMNVLDGQNMQPTSMEYECHSNLVWPGQADGVRRPVGNVFTLTQGQVDVRLPPGFGLPVWSDERLLMNLQVLNLNHPDDNRTVYHRAGVRWVRDRDLDAPLRPLVVTGAYAMVSLEDTAVYGTISPDEKTAKASCHAGNLPPGIEAKPPFIIQDEHGRPFTGHWVVPPGRHEYRTLVTRLMAIPYDTTAHYIAVHVHPWSESVELRDLTTDSTVWKGYSRSSKDRIGLDWIDYFASVEGLPLYASHEYELVSVYDNPTDRNSDAMASVFIYYLDKEFKAPPRGAAPPA